MYKKRGRPCSGNSRDKQYRLRFNAEEEEKLNFICEKNGFSKAEAIRDAIKRSYNLAKIKE